MWYLSVIAVCVLLPLASHGAVDDEYCYTTDQNPIRQYSTRTIYDDRGPPPPGQTASTADLDGIYYYSSIMLYSSRVKEPEHIGYFSSTLAFVCL